MEPAIKSFAFNLRFFTSATDVPVGLGKLWGYSFLPLSWLKTMLGILQTSVENGLLASYISQKMRLEYFSYISNAVLEVELDRVVVM